MRKIIKSLRRSKRVPICQQQPEPEPAIEAPPPPPPPIRVSYESSTAPLTGTREPEVPLITLYHQILEAPQIIEPELPRARPPCDVPEAPPRPLTPTADRRCWRDQISASPLTKFVINEQGLLRQRDVDQVAGATREYLTSWESYHAGQGSDRDGLLLDLIADRGQDENKLMVTLACIGFLSASEASNQLVSLNHLDPAMYLRCLAVASKSRADLIHEDEGKAIEQIRRFQPQSDIDIERIESFLNAFAACRPSIFLPDELVIDWLSKHDIIDRLNAQAVSHWQQQRLHSAFRLVRCIAIICNLPYGPDLRNSGNGSFWRACLCWVPNIERLLQWELGCLSDTQKRQLSRLVILDGPDTATYQESSLRLSEPACFSYAQVEPQTTYRLEQMLALLSASEHVGTNTVDLFIYLLIENPPTQSSLEFLEHALDQGGSDESHRVVVNLLRSQNNNCQDTCTQMVGLSSLLPLLSSRELPRSIRDPATRIVQVMLAAQREFVAQLTNGPGDYVGMSILAFGRAILASEAVHPDLPPDLLAMVRRFPERDVAESIFERLEDAALNKSGDCSALKSYLVSSLGGCAEFAAGDVDLSDIQLEVKFWKSHPDDHRRDLATILAGVKRLDYKTYVTCLASMMFEKDQFVKELRVTLMSKHWGACTDLISYVSLRRRYGQLSADCWTTLVFSFIEEKGSFLIGGKSHMKTMAQWLSFIQDLVQLTVPASQAQLRDSGDGITQHRLTWWQTLSGHAKALYSIETLVGGFKDVEWIFLADEETALLTLIEHAQKGQEMPNISRLVISQLKADGSNLGLVSKMLNSLTQLSQHGAAILQTMLTRVVDQPQWTNLSLAAVCKAWLNSPLPTDFDKKVFRMMRENLKPIPPFTRNAALSLLGQLVGEHDSLVERAAQLETSRWNLKRVDEREHSKLLREAGIRDTAVRTAGQGVPAELADAVEEVAPNEYELSFPLTGLNELQRLGRGVPDGARLLVVRVCLRSPTGFCVHYAPNDEATANRHRYWKRGSSDPDQPICGAKPSLFTYYLSRNLHRLLMTHQTVSSIHSSIEKWVTTSPSTCGVCGALINIRLWKTAMCSKPCSLRFRMAPLEVRLHNLLVDPLSVDLLISSVYAAALDGSNLDLIPGCPVAKASLPTVINSLPPMATLARAPNLS